MTMRSIWCVVLICGVSMSIAPFESVAAGVSGGSGDDAFLQVHLPREVTVRDSQLSLGQVGVLRGPDAVVAKVAKIGLGRFSAPGQQMVLDRPTVLSRLASSGISVAQVRLTGAEAVTVRRRQKIIETEDFLAVAQEFLRQHAAARSVVKLVPMIRPKDLVLAELPEQVTLMPELGSSGRGRATVRVRVNVDGKDMGTREIAFRLRYERHRVVAIGQIPEGTVLSPENVKIETVESDRPEPAGWAPPYGQVATRAVPANVEIRAGMFGAVRSTVVVRRNETVQIRLERPGIVVTAMGTALKEARAGELVKVRNADSRRVILCRVKNDGTVEPIL
jgi:flagella basal body P-ring formation protein FlgA